MCAEWDAKFLHNTTRCSFHNFHCAFVTQCVCRMECKLFLSHSELTDFWLLSLNQFLAGSCVSKIMGSQVKAVLEDLLAEGEKVSQRAAETNYKELI